MTATLTEFGRGFFSGVVAGCFLAFLLLGLIASLFAGHRED